MSEKITLTREQESVIEHSKGHLRIIACPGSGKTEVLSRRIANMIERGIDPKTIVAFTFTEKAAEELKLRIRMLLETRCPNRADFGDMFVGTIHEFCFFMLKEIDPNYRSFDVLDEAKRIAFVSKQQNFYEKIRLRGLMIQHHLRYYQTIVKFLEGADIIMMEDIDPGKLTDERFSQCYLRYRQLLNDEKYLDFSSMIHTFVENVKKCKTAHELLGTRIKHVVVDEYQDVNRIQEMLIELLSLRAESVCVVGDDDQNIYHWRGSDVNFIRTFDQRYSKYNVTDIHLNTNFRSTDAIIYTARKFIENNKQRLYKKMMPNERLSRKYADGDIFHRHFQNDGEEFGFILKKINDLHGTDFLDKRNTPFSISYSDFGILVRTNEDAARIVDYLDSHGIPCIAYSGISIFERPITEFAMDCISYVFSCRGYNREETPQIEFMEQQYSIVFDHEHFPKADPRSFSSKMKKIRNEADSLLARSPKDYFADLGLQGFYYKILNAMGAEDFDFGDIFNYNLAALSRAISDYESVWTRLRASEVEGFFFFVYAYARKYYTESVHDDAAIIDAVHVLTIHKAKGLEYPVVFVPNFEQRRRWMDPPTLVDSNLYDFAKYEGTDEDERRVYYTAMTRSEKYLYITGSREQNNRKKSYEPHDFIRNFDMKYFSDNPYSERIASRYGSRMRNIGIYPTSFSHLSCYGRCPHDFRLRHVYQYNAGVPVTFGYGTNVHNMLNIIHTLYIRKKTIPTEKEIEIILDRIFKLRYATDKIARGMKKSVLRIVKNYVKIHQNEFNRILQTEKKFEFALSDALVSGEIDLLKKVDESGKVTEVEIIDFKTDRNDSVYKEDYHKQLRFYAIACLESLGLKPERAYVHHLDKNKKSYVDITSSRLADVKDEINVQISCILNKDYPPKYNRTLCSKCDYRVICPHKKFVVGIKA